MGLVQYEDEFSLLRCVVLYRPRLDEIEQENAEEAMYITLPDPVKVRQEFDNIVAALRKLGVEVIVLESGQSDPCTSNMIFLRDVAFTFRDKIVLANMKHPIRRPETQKFKQLLTARNSAFEEHLIDVSSDVTMEGADLFALDQKSVCIYTGSRTSPEMVSELKRHFSNISTCIVQANIHDVPQHILGGVHIISDSLATRRIEYCQSQIDRYKFIDFYESEEIKKGFALNIVTLAPNEILMPANNSEVKATLQNRGVICHEVEVSEIHKMGGGLACMVLPLYRERPYAD